MGSDLKRGKGKDQVKAAQGYTSQQKSWLHGDIISCPFEAQLESVTKCPLAAIKLVL